MTEHKTWSNSCEFTRELANLFTKWNVGTSEGMMPWPLACHARKFLGNTIMFIDAVNATNELNEALRVQHEEF